MVGLGGIGYGRAIIPIVGNTIAIGVGQNICATIGWIGRTIIAGISNTICVSIDSIYAGWANIADVTDTIAVGVGLRGVDRDGTVVGIGRNRTTCSHIAGIAYSIAIEIGAGIAGVTKLIIVAIVLGGVRY